MKEIVPSKSILKRLADAANSGAKIAVVCDSFAHCKQFTCVIVGHVFYNFMDGGNTCVDGAKNFIDIDIGKGFISLRVPSYHDSSALKSGVKEIRLTKQG